MEKPFGYCCVNAKGKKFSMTVIALKAMNEKELSAWEKANKKLYPIDSNQKRIKTDEEIGNENKSKTQE